MTLWWKEQTANIDVSPRSADWADRFFTYANHLGDDGTMATVIVNMGLESDVSDDYSMPLDQSGPSTTRRFFLRPNEPGVFAVAPGTAEKFTANFHPSRGKDGEMATIDPATGHEVDYWQLSAPWDQTSDRPQSAAYGNINNLTVNPTFNPNADLVAATVAPCTDKAGHLIDVRTWNGNGYSAILAPYSIGVTTAAEVQSGVIEHVIFITIGNPLKKPVAPSTITNPDDPSIGVTYGLAGLPAGQHELTTNSYTLPLTQAVPDGLRIYLRPDYDIEGWLDSRSYTDTLRDTARCFAVAIRDYGLIAKENGPGRAAIKCDGSTVSAWRDLGISDDGHTLLYGLITSADDLIVCAWPSTTLADGSTTRRAVRADDITYPAPPEIPTTAILSGSLNLDHAIAESVFTASGSLVVTTATATSATLDLLGLTENLGTTLSITGSFGSHSAVSIDSPISLGDLGAGTYPFTITGDQDVSGNAGGLLQLSFAFAATNGVTVTITASQTLFIDGIVTAGFALV